MIPIPSADAPRKESLKEELERLRRRTDTPVLYCQRKPTRTLARICCRWTQKEMKHTARTEQEFFDFLPDYHIVYPEGYEGWGRLTDIHGQPTDKFEMLKPWTWNIYLHGPVIKDALCGEDFCVLMEIEARKRTYDYEVGKQYLRNLPASKPATVTITDTGNPQLDFQFAVRTGPPQPAWLERLNNNWEWHEDPEEAARFREELQNPWKTEHEIRRYEQYGDEVDLTVDSRRQACEDEKFRMLQKEWLLSQGRKEASEELTRMLLHPDQQPTTSTNRDPAYMRTESEDPSQMTIEVDYATAASLVPSLASSQVTILEPKTTAECKKYRMTVRVTPEQRKAYQEAQAVESMKKDMARSMTSRPLAKYPYPDPFTTKNPWKSLPRLTTDLKAPTVSSQVSIAKGREPSSSQGIAFGRGRSDKVFVPKPFPSPPEKRRKRKDGDTDRPSSSMSYFDESKEATYEDTRTMDFSDEEKATTKNPKKEGKEKKKRSRSRSPRSRPSTSKGMPTSKSTTDLQDVPLLGEQDDDLAAFAAIGLTEDVRKRNLRGQVNPLDALMQEPMDVIEVVEITTEAEVLVQEHSMQPDTVPQPAAMEEVATEGQLQIVETMETTPAVGGGSDSENEVGLDLQKNNEETQKKQESLRRQRREAPVSIQRDEQVDVDLRKESAIAKTKQARVQIPAKDREEIEEALPLSVWFARDPTQVTADDPLPFVLTQKPTSSQENPATQDSTGQEPAAPPAQKQTVTTGTKFKNITQKEKNRVDLRCHSRNAKEDIQREAEMLQEEERAAEHTPTVKPVKHQRPQKKPGKYASEQARAFQEARFTKAGVVSMQALQKITVPTVFLDTRLVRSEQLNPQPRPKTEQQENESKVIEARSKRYTETWKRGGGSKARRVANEMVQAIDEDRKQRRWQKATGLKPTPAIRMTPDEMALHAQRAANMRYRDHCYEHYDEMLAVPYPEQGIEPERYCLFCAKALEEVEMQRNVRQNSRGVFHPCKCECTKRFGSLEIDSNRQGATLVSESFWLVETLAEAIEFFQTRIDTTQLLHGVETAVVGVAMDTWPCHLQPSHKRHLVDLGHPTGLLQEKDGSLKYDVMPHLPARIALASKTCEAEAYNLKAPPNAEPQTLTPKAHDRLVQLQQYILSREPAYKNKMMDVLGWIRSLLADPALGNKYSREEIANNLERLRNLLNDPPEERGKTGYTDQANGMSASWHISEAHKDDRRYCMYAAREFIQEKASCVAMSPHVILAVENVSYFWTMTGVPQDATTLVWEVTSDPAVAARQFTTGTYKDVEFLQTDPDSFFRMQQAFLQIEQPLSNTYKAIKPPDTSKEASSAINPLDNARETVPRARMCRQLTDGTFADREKPDPGRDDLQVISGSIHALMKLYKDRFSWPSPSRGEHPMGEDDTRVPRTADMEQTKRNALILRARELYCKAQGCKHRAYAPEYYSKKPAAQSSKQQQQSRK